MRLSVNVEKAFVRLGQGFFQQLDKSIALLHGNIIGFFQHSHAGFRAYGLKRRAACEQRY